MLVPDNLKAAVIKTDRYEPSLNRVMEDMANHYGTFIVPARLLYTLRIRVTLREP